MKNSILLQIIILIIVSLTTTISYASNQIINNNIITLRFHQAPTSIILQALADHNKMNLILDDSIDHLQTIKLHNIDWDKALKIITQSAKLQYVIDGNLLIINQLPNYQLLLEQKRQQQKDLELKQPLVFKSLTINHTDIKSLLSIITEQKVLSERGKAFIDDRTNTLIINDIKPNVDKLESLVNVIDTPLPQVHISAHIVTMSNESASELGIKWGYTGSSSQLINQFDINLGIANTPTTMGFNLAKRSGNLLNLELSALEAENQLEIIASPNLLTAHKHTASIKQGTDIPYEISSGRNGGTSIEFKQAVLGLEVTPRILKDNKIELTLYITQNTAGRSIKRSDGGEALAIDTQEIRTQVLVNSGETLVLGGIFQQSRHQDQRAVPGINKIPIVGGLFKYDGKKLQKRELVIFITPQLIGF